MTDLGDDARGGDQALPTVAEGKGDLPLLAPETGLLHCELQAKHKV